MKLSLLLLLVGVLQVRANVLAQGNITLSMKQAEIEKVLNRIQKSGEFKFLYNFDLKSLRKKVDVNVENASLKETLDNLFANTDLTYRVLENNLVAVISSAPDQQEKRITGRVTSDAGEPISGVSVIVKGTTRGTNSDVNGNYTITVPPNATLVLSAIGFEQQEVVVGDQEVVNVKLVTSNKKLDEVVVIGYGSQRRRDVTGAVATVTAKDFENRPVVTTAQALQGKAAGVQVTQPSGKPGVDFSVRIRGASSINANNDPLYVIDGIPTTDTRGLNPNDIENMQVLKDAASAAIYGARAANGVVLITTKRGKANRSSVGFNTYLGFNQLANKIDVLDAEQYKLLMTEIPSAGPVDPAYDKNTDWVDETFGTGVNQNYQLSFTGGSERTQYFLSLGYLQDKGMVDPARFDRYTARLNLDNKVNNWLKVAANINYNRNSTTNTGDNLSSGRGGVIMSALNTPPVIGIYKDDGSGEFEQNPYQGSWESPLAYMSRSEKTITNRLLANFNADVRLFPGFTYKMNIGTDISNTQGDTYIDPKRTVYGRQQNGVANTTRNDFFSWIWENTLNYTKRSGDHNLNILAGISAQENNFGTSWINTHDLHETVPTTNAGNIIDAAGNTKTSNSLVSNFARLNYDFASKYLLSAAFRYDGSSKLASGNKWDFFPAFTAGWRISSESFMQNVDAINDLKIRASWGQNGNQEGISDYTSFGLSSFSRVPPTNPLSGPAVKPYSIANPDLTWEKTTSFNIGVDVFMLNNRLSLTADAYWKHTKDLIMEVVLPDFMGIPAPFLRNDGELKNKGFELAISSKNTVTELRWNTDLNISWNTNEITSLNLMPVIDAANIYSTNQYATRATVGQPLGAFYGYISRGVDPQTGKIIYEDLDKNGTITPDDRTFIGYAAPKFIYGMTNTLNYKNWDLNIFIQGVQGNDIFNATRVDLEGMFDSKNQSTVVLDRWKQPGDITSVPGAGDINNSNNSTRFIEDGSFLRLKSITLSYSFPQKMLQSVKLQRLSLYATAQNLFTITSYNGFDPEVNAFGNSSKGTEVGVDYGTYPQTRTVVFGLNVEF